VEGELQGQRCWSIGVDIWIGVMVMIRAGSFVAIGGNVGLGAHLVFPFVEIIIIIIVILTPQGQFPRSVRASGPSSLFYMQCILSRAVPLQPNKCCVGAPYHPSHPTVRNSPFRLGDDEAVGGRSAVCVTLGNLRCACVALALC
jgi:hypothetical protein